MTALLSLQGEETLAGTLALSSALCHVTMQEKDLHWTLSRHTVQGPVQILQAQVSAP